VLHCSHLAVLVAQGTLAEPEDLHLGIRLEILEARLALKHATRAPAMHIATVQAAHRTQLHHGLTAQRGAGEASTPPSGRRATTLRCSQLRTSTVADTAPAFAPPPCMFVTARACRALPL
jgi:hypothetical protein